MVGKMKVIEIFEAKKKEGKPVLSFEIFPQEGGSFKEYRRYFGKTL